MPEGDTLKRIAQKFRTTLLGGTIVHCSPGKRAFDCGRIIGQTLTNAESRGKHLLLHFSGDAILHSHLGREGRWRIERHCVRRETSRTHRLELLTDSWVAVCSQGPVIELLNSWQLSRHPQISRLGPDILGAEHMLEDILQRMLQSSHRPLGVVVMDQAVCAGIGNIYKSEMLFNAGLDPFSRVGDYDVAVLSSFLRETRRWMLRNVGPGRRRTRWSPGPNTWVYKRAGERCLKCDSTIEMVRQGASQRSTYFCPQCQSGL